jgi:tetratricopeptide (TPR) repeat protein
MVETREPEFSMRVDRPSAIVIGAFVIGLLLDTCALFAFADPPARNSTEPRFSGLGPHHRKVTTASDAAQEYFDQGLAFLYGFNHDEAIRSFEAAAASDPECAMAFWGIAMANGPHINNPAVDEPHAKAAWIALTKARALASKGTKVEQALIEALGKRYADPQPADRKPLDEAYTKAMGKVWKAYPGDADVGAMTAEAMMDLHPWDQWTLAGKAQPGTDEVIGILDAVLDHSPQHPLALHLMIHAVEASPHPEKADIAANRLRDLEPGLGHMVHMPSHIDVRRGRWQEAVTANEKAIAADVAYRKTMPQQGFYRIYMAHNRHMLAYAAMMQGESAKATKAIEDMLAEIPEEFIKQTAPMIDGFFAMPYELHMRFGRWDAMLAEPKPRACFPITTALWHYARGVSFAAKNDVNAAKSEQQAFAAAVKSGLKDASFSQKFSQNTAADILGVAEKMLAGEILYREGKTDEAVAALREAARREDNLRYIEPPAWIQPVRHALGAALMDAGRYSDAEAVYREDLAHYPENGWSLFGLTQSLKMQGKDAQASAVTIRFDKIWQHADVKLSSSCFCLQGR